MIWTIPNILTFARVLAAPLLAGVFILLDRPMADLAAFFLFATASLTDFFDGWLARRMDQVSDLGKMLDPIADKAMVMIALAVLMALSGLHWAMLVPVALIILREVAISGLREFLGGRMTIAVTLPAKWKTMIQMIAIGALFLAGFADETLTGLYYAMPPDVYDAVLAGEIADPANLRFWAGAAPALAMIGYGLLWIAALLTLVTGWDYLTKGIAFIRAEEETQ